MPPFAGFIGPTYTVQSINADGEKAINLYPALMERDGGKGPMVLYGVPGLSARYTGLAGQVRAEFEQDGRAFCVAGDHFYELFSTNTATDYGAVLNDGLPATIHSNGMGGNQLQIVAGGSGYTFNLLTNTLTLIADVDFPTGTAVMGEFWQGYFFVLPANGNYFQISTLEDGTGWSASDKGVRSDTSDNIVAIIRLQSYVWLLGSRTSEPWQSTGAASFPFAPLVGAQVDMGIIGAFTAVRMNNTIVWLGRDQTGARMVVQLGSATPQRISTHAVELALQSYTEASMTAARAYGYQEDGHSFYVLTSAIWPTSWVYDFSTQLWHERASWNSVTGAYEAPIGISQCYAFGRQLIGSRLSGTIYEQQLGFYSDDGAPIRWLRRAPHICSEQRRIYHSRFQLDLETGVGLTIGQGSDPVLNFRCSNDGGHTWGQTTQVPFGRIGEWGRRSYTWRLGMARDRVYEVYGSDPVKVCLLAAYVDGQEGVT